MCKLGPKRGTKMAPKRRPLCNSLAFWGPTRGPPQRGPQGEMRPQRPCPSRGGSRGRPRRTPTTGPRGHAKGEQPLLEDGVVRKMRAVQPLGSAWVFSLPRGSVWVESGASRRRGVRYGSRGEGRRRWGTKKEQEKTYHQQTDIESRSLFGGCGGRSRCSRAKERRRQKRELPSTKVN